MTRLSYKFQLVLQVIVVTSTGDGYLFSPESKSQLVNIAHNLTLSTQKTLLL